MISRTVMSFLLWMMIVFAVVLLEASASSDKIKLTEVSALTLYKGKMTNGRRSSPVPQLKCTGGSAKGAFSPKVVQCSNQGHDGVDVQWRCDADLPSDIEFGAISVSCEGYNYPEDPYILRGSCGLEYELEYTSGSGRSVSQKSSEDKWDTFATCVVIAFIIYVIYSIYKTSGTNAQDNGYYRGSGGGPGGPGSGGGGGPGGYPSAPPPPYDDSPNGKPPPYGFNTGGSGSGGGCQGSSSQGSSSSGNANNEGGGFWTGAGLGALGGYLASNYLNSGYARPRNRGYFSGYGGGPSFTSSSDSYFSSGPSTSTRQSSGFGGTTRR